MDNQPDSSKRNSSAQLYPKSYSLVRKQKCSFSDAVVISFNYMRILLLVTLLLQIANISLCRKSKIPYIKFLFLLFFLFVPGIPLDGLSRKIKT